METPRETPCETPRELLSQRGAGSAANAYSLHGSRRSSSTKSSKARLAIAQLKLEKLEEEQRLKAVEYELEKQSCRLRWKGNSWVHVWKSNKLRSSCPMEAVIVAISGIFVRFDVFVDVVRFYLKQKAVGVCVQELAP